jgi:NAD(P)-dependent dehydrogenase (short-subunit alcohol dehydrogenase family)
MTQPFGYSGERVVVAGGGGSGMGAAVARLVRGLGADVVVLDLRPVEDGGFGFERADLADPVAIEQAAKHIGPPVHALFNCQGVSGVAPGARPVDVLRVNFLGVRHLTESVLPLMAPGGAVASIASVGGLGWPKRRETLQELLEIAGFDDALRWVEEHATVMFPRAFPDAYAFSKQALIVWTMRRAATSIGAGIRVNCSSPGSTRTPMSPDFPGEAVEAINRPIGRESTPEEQAWPLLFLNSATASYVNGVNLVVDGGNAGARAAGILAP